MTIVRTFGNGTKQLYYDMMKLKKLYRDKGAMVLTKEAPITNNGRCNVRYSREDLQFMHRVCLICVDCTNTSNTESVTNMYVASEKWGCCM